MNPPRGCWGPHRSSDHTLSDGKALVNCRLLFAPKISTLPLSSYSAAPMVVPRKGGASFVSPVS